MATVHTTLTSLLCKNGNHSSPAKFPGTAFLPGFDVVGRVSKKELCPPCMSSGPKATSTFNPPKTNSVNTKQRKHTDDPAAPDFEPLPSFEQCFPRSSKEYRFAAGSSTSFDICWVLCLPGYNYHIFIIG